ncbi:hypothetical protein ACFX13_025268 [Malus domestica]
MAAAVWTSKGSDVSTADGAPCCEMCSSFGLAGLSWRDEVFEKDSLITIATMNNQGNQTDDVSLMGPLINDIRVFLKDVSQMKLSHTRREANQIAH